MEIKGENGYLKDFSMFLSFRLSLHGVENEEMSIN